MKRLLAPRTIALFGSDWADAVQAAGRAIGFSGEVWRVHPKRSSSPQAPYFRSVQELPGVPDAAFIAAPAHEASGIARGLAARGAGGFVCFAAGFSETGTSEGERLTAELVQAAGDLPFFGPNCYGFLNFFDRCALWPDQVVGEPIERGVAIICQSGTLALNLLFNGRSLPIGYVLTVGNQTCLAVEEMIELLANDPRVTAIGLYVEGVKDGARFANAVRCAREARKPIALVKAGRTEAAARTARTHTGSLAGADDVFDAFCRQAGIARCESLATLCETLKVFHVGGPLRGRRILVMGASGGDMAMTADAARDLELTFPPFPADARLRLREILTDKVTISNPFDFHTHIWFDSPALRKMFGVVHSAGFDTAGLMIDCPPADQADPATYLAVIDAFIAAFPGPPASGAVISSLPESMAPATRARCFEAGIVPLQGQRQALEALDLAARVGEAWAWGAQVELRIPDLPAGRATGARAGRSADGGGGRGADAGATAVIRSLPEYESKLALSAFGVSIPRARIVSGAQVGAAAQAVGFPVVIKAAGAHLEHKSELGGVIVNVRTSSEAEAAARRLAHLSDQVLVEEMITDGVAEILVGVTRDAQFGQVLLIGAGGILTELLHECVTLLPPFTPALVNRALERLKVSKLLRGYRGKPAGDIEALAASILGCARYAESNVAALVELDINPIIVRPSGRGAVAVDALIRVAEENSNV